MTMDGVLRLYFGESNLPTPAFIVEAAARALRDGHTFYSENAGLPSLRAAIARAVPSGCTASISTRHREIVVTASGVQALHLAIRRRRPGDEAIILSPAWPNGASIVALCHGVPGRRPARRSPGSATGSTSTRSRRPSRRARAWSCSPRRRTPSAGSRTSTSSAGCSTSAASAASGSSPTRSTSASTTEAREPGDPAPSILRLCDRPTAFTSCSRSRRATA